MSLTRKISLFTGMLCLYSVSTQVYQLDSRIDSECHSTYYTLPECIDHPDGYGCECGPGFHWNTKMCMSSAIDSRFEFKASEPARYTLLLGRAFPKLTEFTVAFWINVSNPDHPGTVLSYKHGDTTTVMRFLSGPKLNFEIWNHKQMTKADLIPHELVHIAWSWSSFDGKWQIFKNGVRVDEGKIGIRNKSIPSGGEFVLGQSYRRTVTFDITYALDGDLSHLNIWNFILPPKEVSYLASSCTFQYCGNAVQWVEFRAGTRGAIKMRWPSGIFNQGFACFTEKESGATCDKSCSQRIGAQCNEEIKENIRWSRQPAQQNLSVPCPGQEEARRVNATIAYATRSCILRPNDNDGMWQEPYIDDCISQDLLDLKIQFQELEGGALDQAQVLRLSERLLNHTEEHTYSNPIDIATVIHLLSVLVGTQSERPQTISWSEHGERYARAEEIYPTFNQTVTFCEIISNIVNNILRPKNEIGWNATQPSGTEGDNLMQVMHRFADAIFRSLYYHIIDGRTVWTKAKISQYHEYIEFKIITQWVEEPQVFEFPNNEDVAKDGLDQEHGFLHLDTDVLKSPNVTKNMVFAGMSAFRYKNLAKILPTHDVKSRTKEDWVNSPVVALYLHTTDINIGDNITSGIRIHLPMLDTFNISNPACVSLVHKVKKQWYWSRQHCVLQDYTVQSAVCSCTQMGVFAVTTDMYNDNWDKGDKRPELMNFASYFGCAASATMCLVSWFVHMYLRTSSSTAALHRNFSVSLAMGQLSFMFGIDRYDNTVACQVFAILLHYSFLTTYSWVMNEAFNLYILITYSAHSTNSDLTDTGSMLRYYILGWVFPAVLVGAFVGTTDKYYATDMCWVAPEHMWLFIGPAIGIMCGRSNYCLSAASQCLEALQQKGPNITILVLIFTAKEHNENSYTKSEKTNKIITIHMKGLWIQIILITVCWSFAIFSIKMIDKILKYLFALFNCLQGAFFVVYYMLLHEEVRAMLKSRQKKKALAWQGMELTGDDPSIDSYTSNLLIDMDGKEPGSLEPRPKRRPGLNRRKPKTRIEASSDECSEHSESEMISSV